MKSVVNSDPIAPALLALLPLKVQLAMYAGLQPSK